VRAAAVLGVVLLAGGASAADEDRTAVRFCAVGDVLLDRGVRTAIDKHGPTAPLQDVAPLLRDHDLALFNLECPLSDLGMLLPKRYAFRGATSAVGALKEAGLSVAGLANNHTLDCGRDALLDTIDRLERAGIQTVGAGRNERTAMEGRALEIRGVKVALLAFVAMPLELVFDAPDKPSVAPASEEGVATSIRRARTKAHVVIVSFHWGREMDAHASDRQRALAHLAVDAGADLVLGHHPHVLQGVEKYRGRLIAFSLGGFLFDMQRPDARQSAVFECLLGRDGVSSARLIPVVADPAHPPPPTPEEAGAILDQLESISAGGGATLIRRGDVLEVH
jgi:poly-gamma-glutamate synthesis protein (capsule biosynthesis protein)